MKKTLITALIFLALLIPLANAAIVTQKPFYSLGYEEMELFDKNSTKCFEMVFMAEENDLNKDMVHIIDAHMEFFPEHDKGAGIDVYLNGKKQKESRTEDFYNQRERIWLKTEDIKIGKNTIEYCLKTAGKTVRTTLYDDSTFGIYRTADLHREDSFAKYVSTAFPEIRKPIEVIISVRNYGADKQQIHVLFENIEQDVVEILEGDKEFTGAVPAYNYASNIPGELLLKYRLFPEKQLKMSLPAAILTYTDEFGEPYSIRSNMPKLYVKEREEKITAKAITPEGTGLIGENQTIRIKVKNTNIHPVQNVMVYTEFPESLEVSKEKFDVIPELGPGEEFEFEFTAKAGIPGKYKIGCVVRYSDGNEFETKCNQDNLFYLRKETDFSLTFAAAFVVFALIIYLLIAFKK